MPSVATPSLPLAERLRPRKLADLIGNAGARQKLREWATDWEGPRPPARRAVLLSGPPGVGKTSAALALAEERGWTLVEMNASDARNERAIEQVAGRASITHTLSDGAARAGPRRALILLDEADCLTGRLTESPRPAAEPVVLREFLRGRYRTIETLNGAWGLATGGRSKPFADWDAVPRSPGNFGWAKLPAARKDLDDWRASGTASDVSDRGGLGAIARLVRATRQPIVLTVNDPRPLTRYSAVFKSSVLAVPFYPIRPEEVERRLEAVVRSERLAVDAGVVPAIVRRSAGDLRAALNDLDAVSAIPRGPAQLAAVGARDLEADFGEFVEEALTAARFYRAGEVRDRLDAPPDDLFPWIEENLPQFAPDRAHRDAAFRVLSAADLLLVRARRARVYGLWSYASELQTGGVGLALRDAPSPGSERAQFPQFLGEMGRSRVARATRDSLAAKAAARYHLSKEKTRDVVLPFLEELSARPQGSGARALVARVVRELQLTPEEVAYITGRPPEAVEILPESEATVPPARTPTGTPGDGSPPATDEPKRKVQRQLSEFGG